MQSASVEKFMMIAFEEARKGLGSVSPNPLVGAVIVKNDRIIARGYHKKPGDNHAEIEAINNATEDITDSVLICNLEPCCHLNKRTAPCAQKILETGIKKVIVSNLDPNPEVSGKGLRLLEEAGIEVVSGVLKKEGEELNRVFFHHIVSQSPYVHLKFAQTMDGKICDKFGDSKWISNEKSRTEVHNLRKHYDAIAIGRETLNKDNPKLNIRMGVESNNRNPYRVIFGSPSKFNWDSYILREDIEKNIYVTTEDINKLDDNKREVITKGMLVNKADINTVLNHLYKLGITSVLVEGGSRINTAFIDAGSFQRITVYQTSKFLGNGTSSYENEKNKISSIRNMKVIKTELIENNVKIEMER